MDLFGEQSSFRSLERGSKSSLCPTFYPFSRTKLAERSKFGRRRFLDKNTRFFLLEKSKESGLGGYRSEKARFQLSFHAISLGRSKGSSRVLSAILGDRFKGNLRFLLLQKFTYVLPPNLERYFIETRRFLPLGIHTLIRPRILFHEKSKIPTAKVTN